MIRLLNRPALPLASAIKRARAHVYGPGAQAALGVAWAAANYICAKRLVPFLPELVPLLEHHGHLELTEETVVSGSGSISPVVEDCGWGAAKWR